MFVFLLGRSQAARLVRGVLAEADKATGSGLGFYE